MFQIKKHKLFASKSLIYKSVIGVCIALLLMVGVVIPTKYTQVSAAGRTSYTRIATFQIETAVSGNPDVKYDILYAVYLSNTIYHDAGIAMVFDPITYHAGETPNYNFTNTLTQSYTASETISNTVANEISGSLGAEYAGVKASVGVKLSDSTTTSYSSSLTTTYTISNSRGSTLPPVNHDGVWGAIYKATNAQYLVVKATAVRKYKNGKEWVTESTPTFRNKDVFAQMIPAKIDAFGWIDVSVWENATAFYTDLNNTYRAPSTEISYC